MQRDSEGNSEIVIDLREIFYLLRRKAMIIILIALVGGLAAWAVSVYLLDDEYSSTSKLYILPQETSGDTGHSGTSMDDVNVGSSLATDYLELVKSYPVVDQVIKDLDLNMKYETLQAKMTVENPSDTRIVSITITDKDPYLAQKIAYDFASVSQKKISEIMKTDEPSIVETGRVADQPSSPDVKRNVFIGTLAGLLLSVLTVIIRYMTDDTIKTVEDVEEYLRLNVLSSVPLRADEAAQAVNRKPSHRKKSRRREKGRNHGR